MSTRETALADELIAELAAALAHGPDGSLAFLESPRVSLAKLKREPDIEVQRRMALRVVEFAHFLSTTRQAPAAGRALLAALAETVLADPPSNRSTDEVP